MGVEEGSCTWPIAWPSDDMETMRAPGEKTEGEEERRRLVRRKWPR